MGKDPCEWRDPATGTVCGRTQFRLKTGQPWPNSSVTLESSQGGKKSREVRCRVHKFCLNPGCNEMLGLGELELKKGKCKQHCTVRNCKNDRAPSSPFCQQCASCAVWGCDTQRREKIRLCTQHEADHTKQHRPPKKIAVHLNIKTEQPPSPSVAWRKGRPPHQLPVTPGRSDKPAGNSGYWYTFMVDREEFEETLHWGTPVQSRQGSKGGSRTGSRRQSIGDDGAPGATPSPRGKGRPHVYYNTSFAKLKQIAFQHAKEHQVFGDLRVKSVENWIEGAAQRNNMSKEEAGFYKLQEPHAADDDYDTVGSPTKRSREDVSETIREVIRRSVAVREKQGDGPFVSSHRDRGYWWAYYHHPMRSAAGTPANMTPTNGRSGASSPSVATPLNNSAGKRSRTEVSEQAQTNAATAEDQGAEESTARTIFTGVILKFEPVVQPNQDMGGEGEGDSDEETDPTDPDGPTTQEAKESMVFVNNFLRNVQVTVQDSGLPEIAGLSIGDYPSPVLSASATPTRTVATSSPASTVAAAAAKLREREGSASSPLAMERDVDDSTTSLPTVSARSSSNNLSRVAGNISRGSLGASSGAIMSAMNSLSTLLYDVRCQEAERLEKLLQAQVASGLKSRGSGSVGSTSNLSRSSSSSLSSSLNLSINPNGVIIQGDLLLGPVKWDGLGNPSFYQCTQSEYRQYIWTKLLHSVAVMLEVQDLDDFVPRPSWRRAVRSLQAMCDETRTLLQIIWHDPVGWWLSPQEIDVSTDSAVPPIYVGLVVLLAQKAFCALDPGRAPSIARLLVTPAPPVTTESASIASSLQYLENPDHVWPDIVSQVLRCGVSKHFCVSATMTMNAVNFDNTTFTKEDPHDIFMAFHRQLPNPLKQALQAPQMSFAQHGLGAGDQQGRSTRELLTGAVQEFLPADMGRRTAYVHHWRSEAHAHSQDVNPLIEHYRGSYMLIREVMTEFFGLWAAAHNESNPILPHFAGVEAIGAGEAPILSLGDAGALGIIPPDVEAGGLQGPWRLPVSMPEEGSSHGLRQSDVTMKEEMDGKMLEEFFTLTHAGPGGPGSGRLDRSPAVDHGEADNTVADQEAAMDASQ